MYDVILRMTYDRKCFNHLFYRLNFFLWLNKAFDHTLTYTCLGPFVWCHLTYHRWCLSPNTQTIALWHSQDLSGFPEKPYQIFSIFSSITRHFLNVALFKNVMNWVSNVEPVFPEIYVSCTQNPLQTFSIFSRLNIQTVTIIY